MGWLRRKDSGTHGLPSGFTDRLDLVLTALPSGQVPTKDVARYVITGEPLKVLQDLAAGRNPYGGYYISAEVQQKLYADLDRVDPELWVRWGRVIEASKGASSWHTPLSSANLIPAWLEQLLASMAEAYAPRRYPTPPPRPVPVPFTALVDVLTAGSVPVAQLLEAVFTASAQMRYTSEATHRLVAGMPGFPEAVAAHLDRLSGRLTGGGVDQRLLFCLMLTLFSDAELTPVAPYLAVAATSSSAKVRDAAQPLLRRAIGASAPALRELAVEAKPDTRVHALELLWQHGSDEDRAFVRDAAAGDRAERIRALVDEWDRTAAAPDVELPSELHLSGPAPVRWRVEPTPALCEHIEQAAEWHNRTIIELNQAAARERAAYQGRLSRPHVINRRDIPQDHDLAQRLIAELASDRPPTIVDQPQVWQLGNTAVHLAGHEGVSAVATVKFLAQLGFLLDGMGRLGMHSVQAIEACHRRDAEPDLVTLQRMLDEMGQPGCELLWKSITSAWNPLARDWPDEHVWPFLARNIDYVVAHARVPDGDYSIDPAAFYRLVATLPAQPPALVEHLYAVALGPTKAHRTDAQHALRAHPDRTRRVAAALKDGKAEARIVAAAWLARIADPDALPALEAALAKEKQDVVKGTMLDALEALGRPVEAYLDRNELAADADKAVAKGLPKDLDWLAWDQLPELHWADSGDRVPLTVVQHLVGQGVRAKSAEPNAILRKYAGMLVESDRLAFAHALLESWLAEDIRPIDPAEAQRRAQAEAAGIHQYVQSYPQAAAYSQFHGRSAAEIAAALLPSIARTPAGSAAASKGVLAVVAAMGGRDVVPPTERYLKEWYGQRAAQGKALIGMLAWVQHPTATQLLLSIGSRFRTKGFQVEATRQIEALAEREGWTVAELADRTVPTAGFDADGRLELSYGERTFTARLLPDLTVELRNEDGAVVKSLPASRQSDDPDQVKAAKAAFTGAKKELKSVVALQQQRLYEALCTERTWSPQDWQSFLAGHPVMRLLCQRLVWVAEPDDGAKVVFRLLDDGTLSGVDDEEVALPADGVVRLAHDTNLSAGEVEDWLTHLTDYEVQPLFQQLGKGLHALPEDMRGGQSLDDFKGHTLEAFTLRNRALKLGWTRGPAEDGGWFHSYLKRFPTLGLVAQLRFTGNSLPEENRTVGLLGLAFVREDPQQSVHASQPVALGDVPAVLLSETWHDVRSIAAEGSGYDPDWERKTEY